MEVVLENALFPSTSASQTQPLPRFFPAPSEVELHILAPEVLSTLPSGFIDPLDMCVLRPGLFTDGPAKGMAKTKGDGGYRIAQEGKESEGQGMIMISRADVAGFVVALLLRTDGAEGVESGEKEEVATAQKWWGHQVLLGY